MSRLTVADWRHRNGISQMARGNLFTDSDANMAMRTMLDRWLVKLSVRSRSAFLLSVKQLASCACEVVRFLRQGSSILHGTVGQAVAE